MECILPCKPTHLSCLIFRLPSEMIQSLFWTCYRGRWSPGIPIPGVSLLWSLNPGLLTLNRSAVKPRDLRCVHFFHRAMPSADAFRLSVEQPFPHQSSQRTVLAIHRQTEKQSVQYQAISPANDSLQSKKTQALRLYGFNVPISPSNSSLITHHSSLKKEAGPGNPPNRLF